MEGSKKRRGSLLSSAFLKRRRLAKAGSSAEMSTPHTTSSDGGPRDLRACSRKECTHKHGLGVPPPCVDVPSSPAMDERAAPTGTPALREPVSVEDGRPEDGRPEDDRPEDDRPEDGRPEDDRPEDGRLEDDRPATMEDYRRQQRPDTPKKVVGRDEENVAGCDVTSTPTGGCGPTATSSEGGATTTIAPACVENAKDEPGQSCKMPKQDINGASSAFFAQFMYRGAASSVPSATVKQPTVRLSLSFAEISKNKKNEKNKKNKKNKKNQEPEILSELPADTQRAIKQKWRSMADSSADEDTRRFQVVCAAILHSQAQESVVRNAMQLLLKEGILTPGGIAECQDLHVKINFVHFNKAKARYLQKTARIIADKNGKVPHTEKGMLSLPGVGRKLAGLLAFVNQPGWPD